MLTGNQLKLAKAEKVIYFSCYWKMMLLVS